MKAPGKKEKKLAPQPKVVTDRFGFLVEYFNRPFFSSRLFEISLFCLIVGLTFIGGVLFLSSDPPQISWSQDVATDPPQYTYFARNHALWGSWDLFGHNRFVFFLKSFTTVFSYLIYTLFGTGRFQSNLVAVILNLMSMILLFFTLKKIFSKRVAFLTMFFLGINYVFIMYGRNPFLEISAIFLIVLGFFFLVYSFERNLLLIPSGLCFATGIFFGKTMAAFILAPCAAVLLFWMFEKYSSSDRKINFKPLILFGAGFLAIALFWLFFSYLPSKREVTSYLGEQALGLYGFPVAFKSITGFIVALFTFGIEAHVSFNIFLLMPVLFLLSFLGVVWYFIKKPSVKELIRQRDRQSRVEFFLVFWFLVSFFVVMSLNYRPLRYHLYLIPPMCAVGGLWLDSFIVSPILKKNFRPGVLFWAFFILSVVFFSNYVLLTGYALITGKELVLIQSLGIALAFTLLCSLFLYLRFVKPPVKAKPRSNFLQPGVRWAVMLILLAIAVCTNVGQFISWAASPKYSLNRASVDLGEILGRDAVVSGPYGPALVWDNRLKDVIHMFGVAVVDTHLFLTYPITHLAVERGGNLERAKQDYPEVMKNAQKVTTYWIREIPVEIYRIAEYTGNPQTQGYQLSDFERSRMLLNEGKADSARILLEKLNAQQPENFSAHQSLAEVYYGLGELDKTEAELKKAIEFHPTDFFIYQQLGQVYLALNEQTGEDAYKSKAIEAWETSMRLCPENTELAGHLRELRGY
jgi:4-amino-4-deoxy-L-arabinose transferase-like glycosyltransferase